jgi:hypothetical protein
VGPPPDPNLVRVAKVLRSGEWRQQVHKARLRLGLPEQGYSLERARESYRTYMEIFSDSPGRIAPEETVVQAATFWLKAVQEARLLCPLVQIDPDPLDRVWETHAQGMLDPLVGIGKLLAPDMTIEKDGREILFDPDPTDRLVGHLVWGLALNAEEISAGPSVSLSYELLENGYVVPRTNFFGLEHATPGVLRELKRQYKELMTAEKRMGMYQMLRRRKTWKDRLEWWNGRYPDRAYHSTGALRKAVSYQMEKSERERGRDRDRWCSYSGGIP